MRRVTGLSVIMVAVLAAALFHGAGPRPVGKAASQPKANPPAAPAAKAKAAKPSPYTLSSVSVGTAPTVVPSSASYEMNWYSVNSGGTIGATSTSYEMSASVGQPVVGRASSPSYDMGAGFWYGVGGCNCPLQGDVNPPPPQSPPGDGVVDVFDVIQEIAIAFSGGADYTDPACPRSRGDVNNDGFVDVFDVIQEIAVAFSGGFVCNPCTPGVPVECP